MVAQSILDLLQGFGVALQPHNLMWSFVGVLIGNLIGDGSDIDFQRAGAAQQLAVGWLELARSAAFAAGPALGGALTSWAGASGCIQWVISSLK